ncbi:MAG: hypothetical protein E7677_02030 [Ruminococcaceae bacterium]|nr:hypothetical protein [Oscillospiraceae bacterium]
MKRKLLILLIALLAVTLSFTACFGGKEEEEEKNNSIQSIKVVEGTYPTQVNLGDTPDFSGIKVTVTYADQSTKEVGFADVKISKVDTTTTGSKFVTVTYESSSVKFEIVVIDPEATATVTGIKIVPGSMPTSCFLAHTLDISKLQVEATYNNGRANDALSVSEYTYTTIDTSTPGEKTFTVTYTANPALTDSITIKVLGIANMLVEGNSIGSKIFVGETLDTSNLKVVVYYEDGTSEIVTKADVTLGTIDSTTPGTKKLAISYNGFSIDWSVVVVGTVGMEVEGCPAEVLYGGTLDLSNIKAYLQYTDGTESQELSKNVLTLGSIDTRVVGDQQLKVSYNGTDAFVTIKVVGVESMTVAPNSIVTEILKGGALDTSHAQISVTYTNGKSAIIDAGAFVDLNGFDGNVGGNQVIKVAYLNSTIEHSIKVCTVTELYVEGINKVLPAGTPVDLTNMVVYGYYNDTAHTRTPEPIPVDSITTTVADINENEDVLNSEENKSFFVKYSGDLGAAELKVTITTTPPVLSGIRIDRFPEAIGLGGKYNNDAVVVYAVYSNDDEEPLTTGCAISIETDKVGDATLTVTYEGMKDEKTVKVLPITKMEVSGIADVVDKGGVLDTSGVQVIVTFSDGTYTDSRTVSVNDGVTVSDPDTKTGGDKTLTVKYLGSETTFAYHVKAVTGISIVGGTISSEIRDGYGLDDSSLMIKITYTNGDVVRRNAKEIGAETAGTQKGSTTFSVTYENCTAEMPLTPISIFVDPTGVIQTLSALNGTVPAEVRQGATLNYADLRLSVTYYKIVDGNVQLFVYLVGIDDDYLKITPETFDTSTTGDKAITFTYKCGGYEGSTSANISVIGVKPAEEGGVEIVSGILPFVVQGDTVNTDNISIKVTYTNGFYTYVGNGANGVTFDEYSTANVGKITFTVRVFGVPATKEIEVVAPPSTDGIIFGTLLPDELVARDSYKKNFRDQKSEYRVGDDNPYYFNLNVISLDENDNIVEVPGSEVPTTAKIYLGGAEIGTKNEYVTFDSANNSYDFTDKAVGKTFTLEVCPVRYENVAGMKQTHTVTVVDGYNIYKAYELNVMTNCSNNIMKAIDGAPALYQKDVATEFLRQKGIVRPETLAGIVLHCNLNVTEKDIPAEYICHYTRNGVEEKGLYDQLGIFHRELSTTQKTFAIYGNYYSVYSYEISPVAHKGFGGNPDDFSSSDLFKIRTSTDVYSSLNLNIEPNQMVFDDYKVNIQDISTRDNDPNSNDQAASERHMRGIICYKLGACVANVTNINIEAYQTSMLVEDANTTLNLNKSNFYNAWQGHLFLWNDNYVQRYFQGDSDKTTATAAYARDVVVNITESSLTKCGGPVIISQSTKTDFACNNGTGSQVNVDADSDLHTYVTGQEAWFVAVGQTQLAAQIKAMNRMVMRCQNNDLSPYYGSHGYLSTKYITNVETVNMVMVNMGEGVAFDGSESYNGYFKHGDDVAMKMSNGKNSRDLYSNTTLDMYVNESKKLNERREPAPVFQSSGGGTALTDGNTGCYGLETGALGAPQQNFYAGRYITLYYAGVGIVMEYYHP